MSSSSSAVGKVAVVADDEPTLIRLCRTRQWSSAIARAAQCAADEAFGSFPPHGTAIATACRYTAPDPVIHSLVAAIKRHIQRDPELRFRNPLRINSEGRGTPLHEAVSNEDCELSCLSTLIRADNEMEEEIDGSRSSNVDHSVEGSVNGVLSSLSASADRVAPRAIQAQDVDGQTPLHLLIRRIFRSCPRPSALVQSTISRIAAIQDAYDATLLSILDEMIEAFPQGCLTPDKREYEETPIVLALKASLYAQYRANPYNIRNDPGDAELSARLWNEMLEDRIYTVVQKMLLACPAAAHHVAASGYTMLHSALFHGRSTRTVNALLLAAMRTGGNVVAKQPSQSEDGRRKRKLSLKSEAFNSGNDSTTVSLSDLIIQPNASQREVPLHICTMRGEVLPTLSLLARHGPHAVFAKDIHGRTPMLWMWIHYCSTKYVTQDEADMVGMNSTEGYSCKEVESTLTYLHMRHVPLDYLGKDVSKRNRLVQLLHPRVDEMPNSAETTGLESLLTKLTQLYRSRNTVDRHLEQETQEACEPEGYRQRFFVSPEEAGAVLLWEKALCLLRACSVASPSDASCVSETRQHKSSVLHVAAINPCVPSSILYVALSLYPNFANRRDHLGRLPIHCAASRFMCKWKPSPLIQLPPYHTNRLRRPWDHHRNFSREQIISEPIVASVLDAYPNGVRMYDNLNRLPLHYAIETVVKSLHVIDEHDFYHPNEGGMDLWNAFIEPLVKMWPGSVDKRDGVTKLYPFMQAAAKLDTTEGDNSDDLFQLKEDLDEHSSVRQLNVIFTMLRLNPELVRLGHDRTQEDSSPSHPTAKKDASSFPSDKKRHRVE
jgi:hypothetical protein